jgi:hypothetical protein
MTARRHPASPRRYIIVGVVAIVAACDGGYSVTPPPVDAGVASVGLAVKVNPLEVGQTTRAFATPLGRNGDTLPPRQATFTSSHQEVAGVVAVSGVLLGIAPGTTQVTATIAGRSTTATVTVYSSPIRISEVRPSADSFNGFVELYNPTSVEIDLSAWTITGTNHFEDATLPTGTTIPAHGFLSISQRILPALAAAGELHVFSRFGVQVDQVAWAQYPATSLARCPEVSGPFSLAAEPTPGRSNSCTP